MEAINKYNAETHTLEIYSYDAKTYTLEITGNAITALDMTRIQELNAPAVYTINIHDTSIKELPNMFIYPMLMLKWENVTSIALPNNALTTLPSNFVGAFPQLKQLNLQNNKIATIPTELFDGVYLENMANLELLNMSNNALTHIPDEFAKLKYLILIDFSNNRLTSLPQSLAYYSQLYRRVLINLNKNEFREIPLFLLKPLQNYSKKIANAIDKFNLQVKLVNIWATIYPLMIKYGHMFDTILSYDNITIKKVGIELFIHFALATPFANYFSHIFNLNNTKFIQKARGNELLAFFFEMVYNMPITNEIITDERITNAFNNSFNPNSAYTGFDITTTPVNLLIEDNPLPELMYSIEQPYTADDYDVLVKYTIQQAQYQTDITDKKIRSVFRGHKNMMDPMHEVYSYLKEPPISQNTRAEYSRLKSEGKIGGKRRRRYTRRGGRTRRRRRTTHKRHHRRSRSHRRM